MPISVSVYTFLAFLASALALALALVAWRRHPATGSRALALLALAAGVWALGLALRVLSPELATKMVWARFASLGAVPAPSLWLILVVQSTGHGAWLSKRVLALLGLEPLAVLSIVSIPSLRDGFAFNHRLVEQGGWDFMQVTNGPWLWAHYVYAYSILIAGIAILVHAYSRESSSLRRRVRFLALAFAVPWIGAVAHLVFQLSGWSALGLPLDFTPIGFVVGGFVIAWAIMRADLLALRPTARAVLFDLMRDAVLVLDDARRVVDSNRAAKEFLRGLGEPLDGCRIEDILVPASGTLDWRSSDFEVDLVPRTEGTGRQFAFRAQGIAAGAGGGGWLLVGRDRTEERAAEQRLLHRQKLESLGQMAGGIAHDFNNIFTSVLGNLELNLMGAAGPEALIEAKQAADRASDLSRQLLVYSGTAGLASETVAMKEVVKEAAAVVEGGLAGRVRVALSLEPGMMAVAGDWHQLQQVLVNLMTNGAEALGESGGTINVSVTKRIVGRDEAAGLVEPSNLPPGESVVVSVVDEGSGIEPEALPRIFDPFFSTKFIGRGLGLSTAQGIVRAHGGGLAVRSEVGRGSEFVVALPATDWRPAMESGPDGESWLGNETVLLVDDEPLVRDIGRRMLEQLGYAVVIAESGERAIELFGRYHEQIEVVVMDLTMPGLDGVETLDHLRRIRPDVPCLLSTGYDPKDTLSRHPEINVAGLLAKPYDLKSLRERLQSTLGAPMRPPEVPREDSMPDLRLDDSEN